MRAFRHARERRASDDDGFTLIEVVVSLVLLSLIMGAVTTLFIGSLKSSKGIQDRQAAVPVATQAMDLARSIPGVRDVAGNSALVAGRTQAVVTAQWAAVAGLAGVDLADTYPTWDTTATGSSTPTLPLTTTVLISGKSYAVQTLVGICFRADVDSDCVKISGQSAAPLLAPAGQVLLYRVIVVVQFSTPDGACVAGCTYVSSTLVDPSVDPTFNTSNVTIPPPVAVGDSTSFNAAIPGVVTVIDVLGNDSGVLGTFPVVVGIPPTKGTVVASSTGIVTYTANSGASGTDYFTYYLRDATGRLSTAATVAITINPRATADGFTTGQGRAVTFNLKTNDIGTYPTSGTTCVAITSSPSNGAVALGTCGSITYTPSGSFTGIDSFRYVITDSSSLESNEVTATVTVYPPPIAANDSATTNATVAVSIPVQSNDTLPAGSATTSVVAAPAFGTASVSGANVVYTPPANYSGTTSFTYRLTDIYTNTSNIASVTIVVRPTAAAVTAKGTGVGIVTTSAAISGFVKGSFSGSYVSATSAAGSAVVFSGGALVYTPKPGYTGTDTVSYTVTDTSGQTATSTWSVTVNAAPTAVNDALTVTGGATGTASVVIPVTTNDIVPGGIASIAIVTPPASGTATVSGLNVTFTSAVGFFGVRTFTYRVTDIYGNSGTATVTVTVNRPAVPTGAADTGTVPRNTGAGVTVNVLANDTKPGGVASITIVSLTPATGTATVTGSGASSQIRYVPTSTTGSRVIRYTITDLYGQVSAQITLTVTVT